MCERSRFRGATGPADTVVAKGRCQWSCRQDDDNVTLFVSPQIFVFVRLIPQPIDLDLLQISIYLQGVGCAKQRLCANAHLEKLRCMPTLYSITKKVFVCQTHACVRQLTVCPMAIVFWLAPPEKGANCTWYDSSS